MVVGELQTPVGALRGSEEGGLCSGGRERLAGGDQRRPEAGAFAAAGAPAVLVLSEQVEGAAAPVDEDPPQSSVRDGDLDAAAGRASRPVGQCSGRVGGGERG